MKIFTRILTAGFILVLSLVSFSGQLFAAESLNISKSVDKIMANPGDLITYTITYSNNGTTAASNVVITDYLPADNYTYVSSLPAGVLSGNTLTWDKNNIHGLVRLSAGSNTIIVTLRAGKLGTAANQLSSAYYISSSPINLINYAKIKSAASTVTSNSVSTEISQICDFDLSQSEGAIKSATYSTYTYLVSIINNGNVYDRYTLGSTDITIDPKNRLYGEILTLTDAPLTTTPYLAPGETYFFKFKLTTPAGTNPNNYNSSNVNALSGLCNFSHSHLYETWLCGGQCGGYNLSTYKIDTPDPVQSDGILTYQIVISNIGDPLTGVTLTETYDPRTTFISALPAPTTNNNTWYWATLPTGNTIINVTTKVNNNIPDNTLLSNTLYIRDASLKEDDTYTEYTRVISGPDLKITKTAAYSNNPAEPGDLITYTLNYENIGNLTAPAASITDNYDEAFMIVTNSNTGVNNNGQLTWSLGNLNPGASGSITYTLSVKGSTEFNPGTTDILNSVEISTTTPESNYNNNTASVLIPVSILPDLRVEKTVSPALELGIESTYTITISNNGDIAATDVLVKDILPNNLTIGTISDGGNNISGTISWPTIPSLSVGSMQNYTVKVIPTCASIGSITNTATVISNIIDKNPNDNIVSLTSNVIDNIAPIIPVLADVTG